MSRIPGSSRRIPLLVLVGTAAVAGAIAYAATSERSSTWRDRDIRIDGSDEEWQGQELPVPKQRFALGLINDSDSLYICLPTKDAETKSQIAQAGLVVWLDPVGGKKKRFGLHFPVPNPPGQQGVRRPPRPEGGEGPGGPPPGHEAPPVPGQDVVGVLGPGKNDARLVPIGEAAGIEGRVGVHGDLMVYELKVPLKRSDDHPFAPQIAAGQTVRLALETAPLRSAYGGSPYWTGGGALPPRPWGPGGWGATVGWGARWAEPIELVMNVHLASGPQ